MRVVFHFVVMMATFIPCTNNNGPIMMVMGNDVMHKNNYLDK